MTLFADVIDAARCAEPIELSGRISGVRGLTLSVPGLPLPVGAIVRVETRSSFIPGEVIGFDEQRTLVMLLGDPAGVRIGDVVVAMDSALVARVGEGLLGRVVNGLGRPIDGRGAIAGMSRRPLRPPPLDPMSRTPIDTPLATGLRAIDAMLTIGRGQRLGVFSAPGLGKSTLLGMMARGVAADVCIVGLIGERGREVGEFVRRNLGQEGMRRSVVVAAASDEPAPVRVRAALLACAAAEYFRDRGRHVLLVMDSVTRFAQAQRQIGLAAGEPPAMRGYPASVFAALPALLERAGGTGGGGSITGLYAILIEGDDPSEPIADACRGLLDGHIVLSRALAEAGHWPAIDVPASISRVAPDVTDEPHRLARHEVLKLISAYRRVEELLSVGAYTVGSDPLADLAIEIKPRIDAMLCQGVDERVAFTEAKAALLRTAMHAGQLAARMRPQVHGG